MPATLYQWSEWFAKARVTLRRGVDYSCPQSTMVQQIRSAASRRKIKVTVDDRDTEIVVEVVKDA